MDRAGTNREAVMVEAADWLARLDAAGEDRSLHEAFAQWKAEAPAHAVAVAKLRHAWDLSERVSLAVLPASRPALRRRPVDGRRNTWLQGAIAASAALFACATLVIANSGTSYATAIGERRLIQLGAGGSVELNTGTRIWVRRRHGVELVDLEHGEIMVKAPDVEVIVAGQRVAARDASFDVRVAGGNVQVAALDGTVRVGATAVSQGVQHDILVGAGQIASASGAATPSLTTAPTEIQRRLAWRQGLLDFDGQTLGEIAAEFNRYNRLELTVSPAVASLRVGGVYDAQAPAAFARSTADAFGLQLEPTPDGLRLAATPKRAT